jgi:hypothetical protein
MSNLIKISRRTLKKYFPKIYNSSSKIRNFIYLNFFTLRTKINVIKSFEEFAPNVTGDSDMKIANTIFNIQNFSKAMARIQNEPIQVEDINEAYQITNKELGNLFQKYGSDKKTHNYHIIYENIIKEVGEVSLLIEIGLGTNNEDVLSNMSSKGRPGSSLRAFRDYLDNTQIVGLDIDSRILFEENRIKTFEFDQNVIESLEILPKTFLNGVDILIDDGLHSPIANINTIYFANQLLKKNGFLIIEDINKHAIDLYRVILQAAQKDFSVRLFTNRSCLVAVLRKL